MYLYGASGHAKVIIDILRANNESIEALFDDNESLTHLLNYPVLPSSKIREPLIISIGDNGIRRSIAENLSVKFGKAIHPFSIISETVQVGEGSVVMQGAIIQSCVRIGRHCIINTGASVDHECVIGDYAHISPHSTLCGNITIGEGTWVGAGVTIIPGVTIGCWSVIGAGSVVTKNIPERVLAVGNPCKVVRKL